MHDQFKLDSCCRGKLLGRQLLCTQKPLQQGIIFGLQLPTFAVCIHGLLVGVDQGRRCCIGAGAAEHCGETGKGEVQGVTQPLDLDSLRTEPARAMRLPRHAWAVKSLLLRHLSLPADTSAAKLTASRATRAIATARLMLATRGAGKSKGWQVDSVWECCNVVRACWCFIQLPGLWPFGAYADIPGPWTAL